MIRGRLPGSAKSGTPRQAARESTVQTGHDMASAEVAALISTAFVRAPFIAKANKKRKIAIRTNFLSPTSCGPIFRKPQHIAFRTLSPLGESRPETFLLTTNDLGVGCGQKWLKVE
jgi:hypothetical protein